MFEVLRADQQVRSPGGTLTFEGAAYGSGVSFFLICSEPGAGPELHKHPYSETWIVRAGTANVTAAGEEFRVGAGDIIVVGAETPHKFKNSGTDRLDIVCIHAAPRMITDWLKS